MQKRLIVAGFVLDIVGVLLLLLLAQGTADPLRFIPGLLLAGLGIGVMLTISVNVVQTAFPEKDQGEISGLSRAVSNLGSSFGTALVGSILVVDLLQGNKTYGLALIVMIGFAVIGLIAAVLLPKNAGTAASSTPT
jgi:MFS family permease